MFLMWVTFAVSGEPKRWERMLRGGQIPALSSIVRACWAPNDYPHSLNLQTARLLSLEEIRAHIFTAKHAGEMQYKPEVLDRYVIPSYRAEVVSITRQDAA